MYFGTRAAVLVYDGVSWRKVPVGQPVSEAHGLTLDPATGTVFVGATDELSYLKSDPGRDPVFVSLLDRLPADARQFKTISHVYAAQDGVYFIGRNQVMRWRQGQFWVWPLLVKRALHAARVADRIYLQNPEVGLLRLENDAFVPASDDPMFHRVDVSMMAAHRDGSVLLATRRDGLFTWRGEMVTPVTGSTSEFLKAKLCPVGRQLRDGSVVLGTVSGGIVVLDENLRFRNRWDESSGLQNESLFNLFEDRENGLWLCLGEGITRIDAASWLSAFDANNGLKHEAIYDLARLDGALFLATSAALGQVRPANPATLDAARCERVPAADDTFTSFCPVPQGLLVGRSTGLSLLDTAGRLAPVGPAGPPTFTMCRSRAQPGRVFLGTAKGLGSVRWDAAAGRWRDEAAIAELPEKIRTIVEDADGSLWLGTMGSGLLRARFAPASDEKPGAPELTSFFREPGPLAGQPWAQVMPRGNDGDLLVVTKSGLYRPTADHRNFERATEYRARFADGSFQIENFEPAADGGLWLTGHGEHGTSSVEEAGLASPGRGGAAGTFQPLPARLADKVGKIECITPDEAGIVWIAGPGGMVHLDTRRWRPVPRRRLRPCCGTPRPLPPRTAATAPSRSWTPRCPTHATPCISTTPPIPTCPARLSASRRG